LNRGQNLFHSFQDFSVPTGGAATFTNPVGNQSIITRVTGNLFSDINGIVNTQGANLFLINPNGIVFGTNAQLNVGQTFVGSTANGIDLVDGGGNGYRFGTNGNDAPLLTINPNALLTPARLILGESNPTNRGIMNYANITLTNDNQYIGLIGGDVTINGGRINALGGRVELGGLSAPGTVTLGIEGNNLRAQFPTNVRRGDVSLTNQAAVSIEGVGGGDIAVNARNIEILGGSFLRGGILSVFGTPEAVAGDINLNATGNIVVGGSSSGIFNNLGYSSSGQSGNIKIDTAGSFTIKDNARIQSSTFGEGNAGIIKIKATGNASFDNGYILSDLGPGGVGKTGGIEINAQNLSITNGAQLAASTYGQGEAGRINITATDNIYVDGIKFESLQNFIRSGLVSTVEQGSTGKGGGIEITSRNLTVTNGANLSARTLGKGDAGNVKITAAGNISFNNGYSSSRVQQGAEGKGGEIEINAQNLAVTNIAQLTASTFGKGDAGSIKITVADNVSVDGKKDNLFSGVFSQVQQGAEGKGGKIIINTRNLSLTNGGGLIVNNQGTNDGGSIVLNSSTINLNTGVISSSSVNFTGGNIDLTPKEYLLMRNNSIILTDSLSKENIGNGGNITINTPFIVTAPNENSDITANAFGGSGGKVKIDTKQNFWILPLSRSELEQRLGSKDPNRLNPKLLSTNDITAISQVNPNLSGQITITPPEIDITAGLSPLPNNITDPTNQINPNCSPKAIGNNSFTSIGRGGIPRTAKDPLNEEQITSNWVKLNSQDNQPSTTAATLPVKPKPIVEAQGWRRDSNGDIVLVAGTSSGTLPRQPQPASGCVDR
jgi:filamentous hemagglutinin family protein